MGESEGLRSSLTGHFAAVRVLILGSWVFPQPHRGVAGGENTYPQHLYAPLALHGRLVLSEREPLFLCFLYNIWS